jgi:hypothetical protein
MLIQLRRFSPATVLCLILALAAAGCSTPGGANSGAFASVTIKNHSAEEISAATTEVFAADGYTGVPSGSGQMVFQKAASRGTSFAREGLVSAGYGAQTINRVKLKMVEMPGNSYRLDGTAYMVTGGDDPFFQNEVPLAHIRRGPYQSLLDKVKKQLN